MCLLGKVARSLVSHKKLYSVALKQIGYQLKSSNIQMIHILDICITGESGTNSFLSRFT